MTRDIFKPRGNPAKLLYEAFQNEAKLRDSRGYAEWIEAECQAVWRAARDYAQQNDKRIPTIEEVRKAGNYASGSIDYGSKWAYKICEYFQEAAF